MAHGLNGVARVLRVRTETALLLILSRNERLKSAGWTIKI